MKGHGVIARRLAIDMCLPSIAAATKWRLKRRRHAHATDAKPKIEECRSVSARVRLGKADDSGP
jgi:hypothetical protein